MPLHFKGLTVKVVILVMVVETAIRVMSDSTCYCYNDNFTAASENAEVVFL